MESLPTRSSFKIFEKQDVFSADVKRQAVQYMFSTVTWVIVRKAAPGHVTPPMQDTLSAYYISAVNRHSDNHQLTHSTTYPADRSFCVRSANILTNSPWQTISRNI
jgi:hypothetical protein